MSALAFHRYSPGQSNVSVVSDCIHVTPLKGIPGSTTATVAGESASVISRSKIAVIGPVDTSDWKLGSWSDLVAVIVI